MLNRYPLWKNLLVFAALVFGLIYAAPNLYPPDPAIQITGSSSTVEISNALVEKALKGLEENDIAYIGSEFDESTALIRLRDGDQQREAKSVIERAVGGNYVVALNKAANTPGWLTAIGGEPMKLGLDLDGGVYFLLEVDIEAAMDKRMKSNASAMRSLLREERNRYISLDLDENKNIVATFVNEELRDGARSIISDEFPNLTYSNEQSGEYFGLRISLSEDTIREIQEFAINQNRTALSNRVNELGVSEPRVARQGANRIVVELPGVQDTAEAKRIIGRTANLEFRMEARPGSLRSEREEFPVKRGGTHELETDIIITGDNVSDARAGFDPQTSIPQVNITLDSAGGERMNHVTKDNVGRLMGVVFIEYKDNIRYENGERIVTKEETKEIISLATVQEALAYQFRITGLDSSQEATELALLLRAGALAAPMYFVEERTVGPSLGAENIRAGMESIYLGLAAVLLFMLIYYRVFGFAANVALAVNLVLLVAWMSLFRATLTLPGIAGIVLTVGMAVDANVLIFSRIREELREGVSPHKAINSGFDRAFVTILDANITTLIVALILGAIGSGPVRGFAVTLSIGIVTSMFTAIMGTRALVNFIYGGRRNLKKLSI